MQIKEIVSKSIIIKSNLPDCDYVVNPYIWCGYGCVYCYASFMWRFFWEEINNRWNYVYAKTNSVELLKKEIWKIYENKSILFSSVTDPYQSIEARYRLTQWCLFAVVESWFWWQISILTKSNLVLRDLEILKKIKKIEIWLTITSTDWEISKYFEKFAPSSIVRLKTLTELNNNWISTYAFVWPLLPHFVSDYEKLDRLFWEIKKTWTSKIYVEHINLKRYILDRFKKEMNTISDDIMEEFYLSQDKEYRNKLDQIVFELSKKYRLDIQLWWTIYHNK